MAATSQIPATKVKLRDLLRAGLPGVQVHYSHPGDTAMEEGIHLGDVRAERQIAAIRTGRKPRDERATIDVYAVAVRPGDDASAAEDAAFDLLARLENVLADDPSLEGQVSPGWATEGELVSSTWFSAEPEGWGCTVRIGVQTHSRLT